MEKRNCNNCNKEYLADIRNLNRGWGLTCSKSCAAQLREKSKPEYNLESVAKNNARRDSWRRYNYKYFKAESPSIFGSSGKIQGITSEGYRVMDGIAYDEFDEPVYSL